MINRYIVEKIKEDFSCGKVVAILGPRQVGKTILTEELAAGMSNALILNCDYQEDKESLECKNVSELQNLIGTHDLVIIDEAQRVKNIGLTLKILADLKTKAQILVTGSSSLDLSNEINEPATGRVLEYNLYPFSFQELNASTSVREEKRMLATRMVFGLYPEVVVKADKAKRLLMDLTNNYLYKDLLGYKGIRKPEVLQKLIRALAFQVGSEVSYNELSNLVGIDKETVENYICLLEKCFVIFRLNSFSRNHRNEIKKGKKVYFYDNGIRNAVISNFAPLELRNDVGALWENLMVSERVKRNSYQGSFAQLYFWRTQQQQEIDFMEEEDGVLNAYEFKWNPNKANCKIPSSFKDAYPDSRFSIITPDNYLDFVG